MNNVMTLKDELNHWDGKVDSLSIIFQNRRGEDDFMPQLVSLLESVPLQLQATWLLKKGLEEGLQLGSKQVTRLLKQAASLDNWQARMHLLQVLEYLSIPQSSADALHQYLTDCLQEKNKFIRAWAYQGFVTLAEQFDSYQQETDEIIEKAMLEEAPAIKARLRNRLKHRDS